MRLFRVTLIAFLLFAATCGLTQNLHHAMEATHDEADCATCLLLHMPLLAAGLISLPLFAGIVLAFLVLRHFVPVEYFRLVPIPCRGPPLCAI